MFKWLQKEGNRWYLYTVFLALVPLLMIYGLLTEVQAAAWVGLVLALLGLRTAQKNVDRNG